MKKCPECGNPSYDGAPVCGNCGYKFPKMKTAPHKREDIFKKEPKKPKEDKTKEKTKEKAVKKDSNDESTISILKNNKLLIGAIVLITLIVICGIFLTGSNNSNNTSSSPIQVVDDLAEFSEGDFAFKYPKDWKEVNGTDVDHTGAKFFDNGDNAIIEYYNVSSEFSTVKEITKQRINYAQQHGDSIELVETVTLDGRNSSNIILENADGDYTRYVSMFSDGTLYVFKITGDSVNTITSDDITQTINSADIA